MKIAVYAISKNEAENVDCFLQSIGDCPVYVLDTGSTDKTVELLKAGGAIVHQEKIEPWRFDDARNKALSLVPKDVDVCVSMDLDERLVCGWLDCLKEDFDGDLGSCEFVDEWADSEKTIPSILSKRFRIHARHSCVWKNAVHELLAPVTPSSAKYFDTSVRMEHHQNGKQRDYEPLLLKILENDPTNFSAWTQLAFEHQQKGLFEEAISEYKKAIELLEKTENPENRIKSAYAWLSVAQCFFEMKNKNEMIRSFLFAVASDPSCREAWTHLAHVSLQIGNAPFAYGAAINACSITTPPKNSPIETACWGDLPRDIANTALKRLFKTER